MTLILEKWIYCDECNKRWKPKDQHIEAKDQIVHMCKERGETLEVDTNE